MVQELVLEDFAQSCFPFVNRFRAMAASCNGFAAAHRGEGDLIVESHDVSNGSSF